MAGEMTVKVTKAPSGYKPGATEIYVPSASGGYYQKGAKAYRYVDESGQPVSVKPGTEGKIVEQPVKAAAPKESEKPKQPENYTITYKTTQVYSATDLLEGLAQQYQKGVVEPFQQFIGQKTDEQIKQEKAMNVTQASVLPTDYVREFGKSFATGVVSIPSGLVQTPSFVLQTIKSPTGMGQTIFSQAAENPARFFGEQAGFIVGLSVVPKGFAKIKAPEYSVKGVTSMESMIRTDTYLPGVTSGTEGVVVKGKPIVYDEPIPKEFSPQDLMEVRSFTPKETLTIAGKDGKLGVAYQVRQEGIKPNYFQYTTKTKPDIPAKIKFEEIGGSYVKMTADTGKSTIVSTASSKLSQAIEDTTKSALVKKATGPKPGRFIIEELYREKPSDFKPYRGEPPMNIGKGQVTLLDRTKLPQIRQSVVPISYEKISGNSLFPARATTFLNSFALARISKQADLLGSRSAQRQRTGQTQRTSQELRRRQLDRTFLTYLSLSGTRTAQRQREFLNIPRTTATRGELTGPPGFRFPRGRGPSLLPPKKKRTLTLPKGRKSPFGTPSLPKFSLLGKGTGLPDVVLSGIRGKKSIAGAIFGKRRRKAWSL